MHVTLSSFTLSTSQLQRILCSQQVQQKIAKTARTEEILTITKEHRATVTLDQPAAFRRGLFAFFILIFRLFQRHRLNMSAAGKIVRSANAPRTPPSDIELQVGTALLELENSVADLKAELRPLQISSAQEIDVNGGRKAVVMWVQTSIHHL